MKILIFCSQCKKERLVETHGMLKTSYEKLFPKCHKCGFNKENSSKTWFKKGISHNSFLVGHAPWNKNLKGIHLSPKTEFVSDQVSENKNFKWKENKVGYYGLHTWINRKLGKAKICQKCGSDKKVQWANKSWKYKRDINDWLELCFKCHRKYDMNNWGEASRLFPELKKIYV